MKPKLFRLAKRYSATATIGIFNTSKYPEVSGVRYPRAYPTFYFFFPGHEKFSTIGARPRAIGQLLKDYPDLPGKFKMKQPDNGVQNHFIIGGATDITNFGNEVVKHAAILEDLEIEPRKIGCYFNQPNIGQKYFDRKDYELLEQASRFCLPAKKKRDFDWISSDPSTVRQNTSISIYPLMVHLPIQNINLVS